MKVFELIEVLRHQDPQMQVAVDGYEGGYEDVDERQIVVKRVEPDPDPTWVYGRWQDADRQDGAASELVLLISRNLHGAPS